MLKDQDRIFTNLYGMHDRSLAGARKRGHPSLPSTGSQPPGTARSWCWIAAKFASCSVQGLAGAPAMIPSQSSG